MLWDICTSLTVSFILLRLIFSLYTHTHARKDRTLFFMTDGKSTIARHQSLKTQTHTTYAHTQTNTTSLSSCPFVPSPPSDVLICLFQLRVCISVCMFLYLGVLSTSLMRAWWGAGPSQWTIWGTFSPLRTLSQTLLTWLPWPSAALH